MLGQLDADAQLDIVEEGIEAGLIALARLGENVEHGVEAGGVDPTHEEVPAQRLELVEQPLPAPNRPAPAFERIAHRLQCEQPLNPGDTSGHGDRGRPAGCCLAADDEIRPGRATGATAPCHSRYSRIAVDPHQTHLRHP